MPGFQPEDVYRLVTAGDPRISPDGRRVAYVVTSIDREANGYRNQIWIDRRPFTSGKQKEKVPRWSPDGKWLAYVRHESEDGAQLMVAPLDGGEPVMVVEWPEDIEDFQWSPDSRRIAFAARNRDEEVYGKDKDKDRPARRITRMFYRLDNVGWTIDRPRHLFLIDVDLDRPVNPFLLTPGDSSVSGISWAPDSSKIAFASGRHETWDSDLFTDLFTVTTDGEIEQLTETGTFYSQPSFSPEGGHIAFEWSPASGAEAFHGRVGVMDIATRKPKVLTANLDRNVSTYPAVREPIWSDGYLYFTIEDSGNIPVMRVPSDGSADPEEVLGGDRQILGLDVRDGRVAAAWTTATSLHAVTFGDVEVWAPVALDDREIAAPEGFTATSDDGSEIQAWVIRPVGFEQGKTYPMLLNIHGGPFTQYGNKFFDEFQTYASAGYVIVYANPRGSSGYSEKWGQAINGPKSKTPGTGWGSVDYDDLMAVTDEALKRFDFIDPERTGVMGGSYGGYMTSWIVGHTDRFKAAISERAVNNMTSQGYTCDFAPYFSREMGPTYLEDPEEYKRVSPITYVKNIKTPLLIIHSDNDLRCPVEQAEQMFMALRLLEREVEFIRFPGEGHELSRSGAPFHRVERLKIVLEWFDRHIKAD